MTLNDFEYLIPVKAEVQLYDDTTNSHIFTGKIYEVAEVFKNKHINAFKVFTSTEFNIYRIWI